MDLLREILERLGQLAEASIETLRQAEQDLIALGELTAGEGNVAGLESVLEATRAVRAEMTGRAAAPTGEQPPAAGEPNQERIDQMLAELRASTEGEPPAGEDPAGEQPPAGTEQPPETPAGEQPPAGEGAQPTAAAEPPQQPAIAASAQPVRPSISDINARRGAQPTPAVARPADRLPVSLIAAADIHAFGAGTEVPDGIRNPALWEAFMRRREAFKGEGSGGKFHIATARWEYPEERQLDLQAVRNMERIAAVTSEEARVASGGLCAPLTPRYDEINLSVADRPLRDALAQFNATRGGVTWIPSLKLSDLSGTVGVHTVTNDEDGDTKSCDTIDCGEPQTTVIEAIYRCIQFGNLNARTFPERIANALDLAMANHARLAERQLLAKIAAASTPVSAGGSGGTQLGATRQYLRILDRVVSAYRNRHRMRPGSVLQIIEPTWLDDLFRADLTAEMPGSSEERLATADAQIARWYAARNVQRVLVLEGESGQDFGTQAAGALLPFKSTVISYLFHPGMFLFLDGGTLDLGLVRDSTLNSTNDYQMFMETFESVAPVGLESLKITSTICPNGASSAAVDFDDCAIGS